MARQDACLDREILWAVHMHIASLHAIPLLHIRVALCMTCLAP
jgi:hypothetical protein